MIKEKLIPEIRFPEFKNEGEWEIEELNELGELINGLTYSPDDVSDKGLLVLRSSNIQNGMIELNDCVYVREGIKGANLSKPNDILVCVRNGSKNLIGKNAIIPKGLPLSTHGAFMTVFRASNPEFVFQLFQTDFYDTQVKADLGATINSINGKNFLKYEFPIPKNPKEQQKIAYCLSSLDEVISANSQKLDLLKDHKKALMQNLFPQEGEKVPKYRFKEFEKDGEWVEKKLGELIELKGRIGYRGYTLEDIVGKGEGAISMSPSNINEFGTLSFTKSTYITWAKYEESPEIVLQNGFTVLVKTGSTFGKVAYIKNLNDKTTINPQLVVLKPKKVDSYFLYLLVSNTAIQTQINETVVGGAIPTLSQESISKFEILVPKTKEQEKIADCLSSLNDLIISQTERIEQLKLHKKGLMQGLFPKIND
jgi:type I restriction enzyme S subunit